MDNIIKKVFYVVSIILFVIASIYQIVVLYQGDSNVTDGVLDGYFFVTYVAFGIAILLALIFPVIQMISNPKGAVKTLIIIGGAIVLWFVARAMATNQFDQEYLDKMKITAETSINVGAGLIFTYFVFVVAILSILYASISNMFK